MARIENEKGADRPLISVVTITYNAGRTLPATMESVASQKFGNYEHLIIDGASKDDTLDVASRLRTPSTRIVSEPDKGLYDAMNKGLHLSRGEYVLFLNAGDAFADSETLRDFAEETGTDVDIIYGDTLIVDADRRVISPRHLSVPEELTFKSFSGGMLICHQAFMVRRDIAPDYDLQYRFSADYDWTVKCIKATSPERCRNLHRNVIHYLSDGLTDNNKMASLKERYKIMCRHYGTATATMRHIGFLPRAIKRKFTGK